MEFFCFAASVFAALELYGEGKSRSDAVERLLSIIERLELPT